MQVAQDNLCLADCFWNRDEDACPSEVVFATHNHGHACNHESCPSPWSSAGSNNASLDDCANERFLLIGAFILTLSLPENEYRYSGAVGRDNSTSLCYYFISPSATRLESSSCRSMTHRQLSKLLTCRPCTLASSSQTRSRHISPHHGSPPKSASSLPRMGPPW